MSRVERGERNLITDVNGIEIGNAEDEAVRTGVTVLIPAGPVIAACDVRGGAPGTRETDALDPSCLVERIHGLVLSGGSVFGLEAASGVVNWLASRGKGYALAKGAPVAPVVPSAILFDLANGGDKSWGLEPPYRALALKACDDRERSFALGNAGAGFGALAGRYKGGLGSASALWERFTVGALVAVNSSGSPVLPGTDDLWAADYAMGDELPRRTGHGTQSASLFQGTKFELRDRAAAPGANTTIAIIATDAVLTKSEAKRLAIMAHDGMARALRPAHTPFDGDTVFAIATSAKPLDERREIGLAALGAIAADTLARAIGRALWEASSLGEWKSYRDQHRPSS
jgi:L-aminopeptidase/D-esterase-like protein